MTKKKALGLLQHYAYAAVSGVVAAYVAGYSTPKDLGIAVLAAIIAPVLVALDPTNALAGIHAAPPIIQVGAEAGLSQSK
jgi:hypothetical protein